MVGLSNSLGPQDIADYYKQLERRVARLERGVSGTKSTDSTVITSLAITGLSLASQVSVVLGDTYNVYMKYDWDAVPDDPSEYNKDALDGYLTGYSLDGVTYTADAFTTDTNITLGAFPQGQVISFRVRARSEKGTLGDYSVISNTTTTDATAPFQPATPVVSPYLGQLAIAWNGLSVSSTSMPTDFKICEVHLSTSSATFTPSATTLVGTLLRGGGTWVATDLNYGQTYYARLVAVDSVGNRSVASTGASGVPVQAADGDIAALGVGKLTAGVISAIMTITGRLATSLTGARAEMNSSGFQAYNSGGSQTFSVAASTGAVTITGAFKTNFAGAGAPYLAMTNSTDRTTIDMFNAAGSDSAYINSPQDGSGRPMIGINGGQIPWAGVTARPRIFFNSTNGIQLETVRTSDQTAYGGALYLTSSVTTLGNYTTGAVNGGQLYADGSALKIAAYTNAAALASEIALFDDESIWITGRFSSSNSIGGKSALYCDTWAISSAANDFTVSYGSTMSTAPVVLYSMKRNTSNGTGERITAQSTTSFIVHVNTGSTDYTNLNYWAYRVI
jgi:hypothetical protein